MMHREAHYWYSHHLGRELGVVVYGHYDENFYFNNPVDYAANLTDGWALHHLASCDLHLATGTGPWEHPAEAYRLSGILASRGIPHHLDDWGPQGGHDWPYWRHMMWEYMNYV